MARPNRNKSTKNKPEAAHRKDAAAAVRALQALELRLQGLTYEEIARQCGYAGRQGAYNAVQRELHRTMQEPAEDVRALEVKRLDRLYRAMETKAIGGGGDSTWYVDRCLKIMDRRAALLGLDIKVESGSAQIGLTSVPIAADIAVAL